MIQFDRAKSFRRIGKYILRIGYGVIILGIPVLFAANAALVTPTYHLDGAFQTFSSLARLSDGELPGRDFLAYLGIAPIFIVWPVFAMLGSTLGASVFSAYLTVFMAMQLTVGVIVILVTGSRKPWRMLCLSSMVVSVVVALFAGHENIRRLVSAVIPLEGLDFIVDAWIQPGNSLRPLRSFAAYFLALVLVLALRYVASSLAQSVILGSSAGLVLALWSSDHAFTAGLLFVGLVLILKVFYIPWRWREFLTFLITIPAVGVLMGFMLTGGGWLRQLRYSLIDARGDQFWYFGQATASSRIYTPADILNAIYADGAMTAVIVIPILVVAAFATKKANLMILAYIGLALLSGGMVATYGGHIGNYFEPLKVWGFLTLLVGISNLIALSAHGFSKNQFNSSRTPRILIKPAFAIVALLSLLSLVSVVSTHANALRLSREYRYVPDLASYLPLSEIDQLQEALQAKGTTTVEEYSGIVSALNGHNRALMVDSVIHALGAQRLAFKDEMAAEPSTVISTNPSFNSDPNSWSRGFWASWNVSLNWWFYQPILARYEVTGITHSTYRWKLKSEQSETWREVGCSAQYLTYGVSIAAPQDGLYEVKLKYTGPGRSSRVTTNIQNNINMVTPVTGGFMPLDPGASEQVFPLYAPTAGAIEMKLVDVGSTNSSNHATKIESCTARLITGTAAENIAADYQSILSPARKSADFTTTGWTHGVRPGGAAILVPFTPVNRATFTSGKRLQFKNGNTSVIQYSAPLEGQLEGEYYKYLEVYLQNESNLQIEIPNEVVSFQVLPSS